MLHLELPFKKLSILYNTIFFVFIFFCVYKNINNIKDVMECTPVVIVCTMVWDSRSWEPVKEIDKNGFLEPGLFRRCRSQ